MLGQELVILAIPVLTLARIFKLATEPVQRDVEQAQLPLLKQLQPRDFFQTPRSEQVRFAFYIVQYGTLWYAINLPLMHLASFQGRKWTVLLALIDMGFVWLSFRLGLVGGLLYVGISSFMLFKAPWNMSILWLTTLGVFSWAFLLLAPLAKLPIGIPVNLWRRVRQVLFYQKNFYYYSLLGMFWLFVFIRTLHPQWISLG